MSIALLLAAAIAQNATTPPPTATNPNARECRKLPAPTGSRVAAKRVCRTAAEWAAIDQENNSDVEAMRRRTSRQTY